MKNLSSLIAISIALSIIAGSCDDDGVKIDYITFEELPLDSTGYWNGSDMSGGFTSGNAFFPNSFTDWGGGITSWMGFGYSNMTDVNTPGPGNQYSCYAGSAIFSSGIFGIISVGDTLVFEVPERIESLYVANTTYAALSMKNGDEFAKKFGGDDGNDPDYFYLVIDAFNEKDEWIGNRTAILANYTFEDNSQDYISNGWTKILFEDVGYIKKLAFSFESTDVGEWGINTPAYACIDNIKGVLQ